MKPLYLLTLLLFIPKIGHSQNAQEELDINDALARFFTNGAIGKTTSPGSLGYFVPANSGISPLYTAGLWIAGVDDDGELRIAAHLYGAENDFYPGPLTTDGTASITSGVSAQYDQIWKINRSDVLLHQDYYECLADPNCDEMIMFPNGYVVPGVINTWPAHGNVNDGQALYLAPFQDMNTDGFYDPSAGDHPCVPGDQALYMIFNDNTAPHGQSLGLPLGVEVHMMPFAYVGQDPALDQTIFVHYKIINRSDLNLNNVFIGTFADLDIGCSNDDFIGSDVGRNMMFTYNWDDLDASCVGSVGYGDTPPAFGIVTLKGPLVDQNSIDDAPELSLPSYNGSGFNDGVIDNERHGLSRMIYFNREGNALMTDPYGPAHYYDYLRGKWKNGLQMSYGGTGYPIDTTSYIPAYFMYPGDTDTLGVGTNGIPMPPWSENEQGTLVDRRGVASMGPFTFEAGEEDDILLAYVFARAQNGGAYASVEALKTRVDSVRAFAETIPGIMAPGSPCDQLGVGMEPMESFAHSLRLFPNPATNTLTIDLGEEMPGTVQVHDAQGALIIQLRSTRSEVALNVNDLSPGLYHVLVRTAKGIRTGRFIKE